LFVFFDCGFVDLPLEIAAQEQETDLVGGDEHQPAAGETPDDPIVFQEDIDHQFPTDRAAEFGAILHRETVVQEEPFDVFAGGVLFHGFVPLVGGGDVSQTGLPRFRPNLTGSSVGLSGELSPELRRLQSFLADFEFLDSAPALNGSSVGEEVERRGFAGNCDRFPFLDSQPSRVAVRIDEGQLHFCFPFRFRVSNFINSVLMLGVIGKEVKQLSQNSDGFSGNRGMKKRQTLENKGSDVGKNFSEIRQKMLCMDGRPMSRHPAT
jgi:hypothetical protein